MRLDSERSAEAVRDMVAFATGAYTAAVGRSPAHQGRLYRHPEFDGAAGLRGRLAERAARSPAGEATPGEFRR